MRIANIITFRSVVVISLAWLVKPVYSDSQQVALVSSTVCELARNSARYLNQTVSVHANIRTGGIHPGFLDDPSCSGSELNFDDLDEKSPGNPGKASLDAAIFRIGSIGTADKSITATLVGRVTRIGFGNTLALFSISDVSELSVIWKNRAPLVNQDTPN